MSFPNSRALAFPQPANTAVLGMGKDMAPPLTYEFSIPFALALDGTNGTMLSLDGTNSAILTLEYNIWQ